jgi:DHA1 family inner membrane transport protein
VLAASALAARTPVAAVVLLVLFGTLAFALGPVVQNGVIEAARVPGGSLVSAANQGPFTVATALGAALGAAVLSAASATPRRSGSARSWRWPGRASRSSRAADRRERVPAAAPDAVPAECRVAA